MLCLGHSRWGCAEIMSRFALVNNRSGGLLPVFTWLAEDSWALHAPKPSEGLRDPLSTYVPEPWADTIVDLHRQGAVMLSLKRVKLSQGRPNRPVEDQEIVAEMADGSSMWLHWKGGNKFGLHPLLDCLK
jgi:hypothetical protein